MAPPAAAAAPVPADATALPPLSSDDADKAAKLIQRNYRGYRERRQLSGRGIDATSKQWATLAREAQWRHKIQGRPRHHDAPNGAASTEERRKDSKHPDRPSFAAQEWKRLAAVARQAGNDDPSSDSDGDVGADAEETAEMRRTKTEKRRERAEMANMMGLSYFLELVDEKHRYGSHLRTYHAEWMKADTRENFFFWLDHGDGREVEVPACSREVLERDQVRYLGREERQRYVVNVGSDGRLYWAKNGKPVHTTIEYRDSVDGIVPADSSSPAWREDVHGTRPQQSKPVEGNDSGSGSLSSLSEEDSADEAKHYVNKDLDQAKGIAKVQHVSAGAVMNHLLSKTTKKNTWIFATDKNMRLYVGIKQSGAFQHSSFLHGGRLAAAGLIKVKNGQLRSLSPLSGHYRPPTRNFRAFVKHLDQAGADMSRVSISRSYAVLLGLEGYIKTKNGAKQGMEEVKRGAERVLDPAAAQRREAAEMDSSQSAKKEREHLEKQAAAERKQREERSLLTRMKRKLRIGGSRAENKMSQPVSDSGTDAREEAGKGGGAAIDARKG